MPTPEQIKQMQQAGLLPQDLSQVDPSTFQGVNNPQSGAAGTTAAPQQTAPAGAPGTPAPLSPEAQQLSVGLQQAQPAGGAQAQSSAIGTGAELSQSPDSKIYESGGSLKIDAPKLPVSKPAPAPAPEPAKQAPADTDDSDVENQVDSGQSDPLPSSENAFKDESTQPISI